MRCSRHAYSSLIYDLYFYGFDSVHAFAYNFIESEPIWVKSGALWLYCLGLAMEYFEHDLCSSESGRAMQIFFCQVKQRMILPLSLPPHFMKFAHNTSISELVNSVGTEF